MKVSSRFLVCFIYILAQFYSAVTPCSVFAETETDCVKERICVVTEKNASNIVFSVRNLKNYDQTLTFDFTKLENMTTDTGVPITFVCPARSETLALKLYYKNDEAWNYSYKYWFTRGNNTAKHDDYYIYKLPFRSGETYGVIQGFNGSFSHKGRDTYAVDFAMPEGTTVFAAREGKVVGVYEDSDISGNSREYADFGNYVFIEHSDKTIGEYWHIKKSGALVSEGEFVNAGTPIAISGNTGFSSGPHLHFSVTTAVDGQTSRSFRIRFRGKDGIIPEPLQGRSYTAD